MTLSIANLTTRFDTDSGPIYPVRDVSLEVEPGKVLGLVGESGSGKSMLGFSIMGLIDPPGRVEGSVCLDGREIRGLPEAQMRRIRGSDIAMIFQDPMMTLNPVLRVGVQMTEAIRAHRKLDRKACREKARDALGRVGIPSPEERLDAYPHEFSGGMRQRVAIAIALLNDPKLIIADEPTTALDVTIQSQILAQMQQLLARSSTALIWISHDLSVVSGFADRISVMYAGRIVEEGPAQDVLTAPAHPYTIGLIGSLPAENAPGRRLTQIPGAAPPLIALPQGCAFGPRCTRRTEACAQQPDYGATDRAERRIACFHPGQTPERIQA